MNKTHVGYQEKRSAEQAKKSNRYGVLTQQIYSDMITSESDKAGMEESLGNMWIILGAFCCEAFELLDVHSDKGDFDRRFCIQAGSVSAEGDATPYGFVAIKRSTLCPAAGNSLTAIE